MQRRRKRGKYYPTATDVRRVTVEEIADQIGRDVATTRTLIATNHLLLRPNPRHWKGRVLYDARVIELLKAMLGQVHRPLEPGNDWLSAYEKENHGTAEL